eukprot:gene15298-32402_t
MRAVENIKGSNTQTMKRMFVLSHATKANKKAHRTHVSKMFTGVMRRYLKQAFTKWSQGFFGLTYIQVEADGLAIMNKFDRAYSLYEAQIISLRSEKVKDVKILSVCHGRLGRLFLREDRFDRAIVEFDRQMSLAKEIDDKAEEAEAFYGIGTGYVGRCDYIDAIKYLEIAQVRFDMLGHIPKSYITMKSLKECYIRMQRADLVEVYTTRMQAIENEH